MLIFKVACMHFMQWMECAMYYEISVFDTTCFQSTIWVLQMYAVGWNQGRQSVLKSEGDRLENEEVWGYASLIF